MGYYINKLGDIIAEVRENAEAMESATNTVAMVAVYRENADGSSFVTINGYNYTCAIASLDLILVDGCRVMVIPDKSGGNMIIVGGGLP